MKKVRNDCPILNSGIIYFDNAASSLTPEPVIQKMLEYYRSYRANIERGVHKLSQKASQEYENARSKIARFINAESDDGIIITKNTTEGINLVANGIEWKRGDTIVTTLMEHHSNFIVWLRLKQKYGLDVKIIEPNSEGLIETSKFENIIDSRTKLVALGHVSNVLGSISPVKNVARMAHDAGAQILVDGAQSAPHMRIDVNDIDCDYFTFSGHKMLGPTGVGTLYVKENAIEELVPSNIGGGSIIDVTSRDYLLTQGPTRYEAGTPPIAEAIGLGAAIDYLQSVGMDDIEVYERELTEKMYSGLKEIDGVKIYGPRLHNRIGIISFGVNELNPHDVALTLDAVNIMVRSGHHCAMPLVKQALGLHQGSVRASLYLYNTKEEVEKFISTVDEIANTLT